MSTVRTRLAVAVLATLTVGLVAGTAVADKYRFYAPSWPITASTTEWAMVYGKSPYYTEVGTTLYNHDAGTSVQAWTYWSIQKMGRSFKWNSTSGAFERYTAPPTVTELNDAYKEKTQAMITAAPTIFFLCANVPHSEFDDVVTMITVNKKVCGDPAITVTGSPDVKQNELSYTGYELLCLKTVPGALAKTTFFDLREDTSGSYLDHRDPDNWYWTSRCHGATDYMK